MIKLVLRNITEVKAFAKVYFENTALLSKENFSAVVPETEGLVLRIECPVWKGGLENEAAILSANYRSSLKLALDQHADSIAFHYNCPGKDAFPDELACQYSITSVSKYLFDQNSAIEVIFVSPYQYHHDLYNSLLYKKIVRRSFRISGRVQGVFYRQSTSKMAQELGLKGFVLNENDGHVYAEVQGSLYNIHLLFDWCLVGPPAASVYKIEVEELTVINEEKLFTIKR